MSMTKTDKQALRLLAEKATPGNWWVDSHGNAMVAFSDDSEVLPVFVTDSNAMGPAVRHEDTGNLSHWRNDNDASFIATANPKTVLALLDELEAKDKNMAKLESDIKSANERYENRTPTQWAYDQACAAIGKHRSRAEAAEKRIANLFSALKLIESEVSERFDMDDSKTNPGIKHAVEQAQSALSAGIALDTGGVMVHMFIESRPESSGG